MEHDKAIQGEWAILSYHHDGEECSPSPDRRYSFRNGMMSKSEEHTQKFRVDATTTPKQIDIVSDDGAMTLISGIYALDGDILRLCWSFPDDPRPNDFATRRGDKRVLYSLQRVRPQT